MWKQVFAPTLLVSVLWVVFSGLTTWYIHWQDNLQSRLLVENVASIRATGRMQQYVWQMEAVAFDDHSTAEARAARLKDLERRFAVALEDARAAALSPPEIALTQEIARRFEQFRARLHGVSGDRGPSDSAELQTALDSADAVVEPCQQILRLNEEVLKQATASRQTLSAVVFFTRVGVLMIGPALGIWLGLRISRQLHRSISEISITLKDAAGELGREIGRVNVSPNVDLPDLRRQVQAVSVWIRQTVEELNQARQEALRRERLAAVGELGGGVAHELRNPMTSVKLLLQSAAQKDRTAAGERQFQIILDEFARMENTIQGLLDFARPPQLRRVPHDLRQTLRRALNLVDGRAQQQNVLIETDLCTVPLEVDGDPEQLHQVFINLLLNAMESMPQGGLLTVQALSVAGTRARVVLADTGAGIPAAIFSRLFEPFVTTKERGVGLGLAITRRIIHDHQGRLLADNRPGGGAEFCVELPLTTPLAPLAEAAPAEEVFVTAP